MKLIKTAFKDVYLIEIKSFPDDRGVFYESYSSKKFRDEILRMQSSFNDVFFQDNISISAKHVLRGLHFQSSPYSQGKLIKVLKGSIYDVVVDLRLDSSTFGKWESYDLNDENNYGLWVPKGFAHGFISLEDNSIVSYKASNPYNQDYEKTILWNDSFLNIKWPFLNPIVSKKDLQGIPWNEVNFENTTEFNQ